MNAEKIIKALECCGSNPPKCSICDYRGKIGKKDCYDYLKADALALIKEQQAEIEKYKKLADLNEQDNKDTCELLFKEEEKCKDLQAHNENLKKENKYLRESLAEEMEHKKDMGEKLVAQIKISEQELKKIVDPHIEEIKSSIELDIKAIEADTVKKMQDVVKSKMVTNVLGIKFIILYEEELDQIAKEILEGNNEVQ